MSETEARDMPQQLISQLEPVAEIESQFSGQSRYGVMLGSLGLLYDGSMAVEVADPITVSPLPNVPGWILGMINMRGNLIPLFDLKVYLGMMKQTDVWLRHGDRLDSSRFRPGVKFLVFGDGNRMAAVVIDQLPTRHVFDHGSSSMESVSLPSQLRDSLTAVRMVGGKEWFEVDVDKLFSAIARNVPFG